MKIFKNKKMKSLLYQLLCCAMVFIFSSAVFLYLSRKNASIYIFVSALWAIAAIFILIYRYFRWQEKIIEDATHEITNYMDGDKGARISCNEEGELYLLFQRINSLVTILNAQAESELKTKVFLKDTISNISHQLKTPLAALNIYNGILQEEAEKSDTIREFTTLSEQELDRIESLVQNLLKIAKLDAGTLIIEKKEENILQLMNQVQAHFQYRCNQEGKVITLDGSDEELLLCDASWLIEALDNIVKNALDHMQRDDSIYIEWRKFASFLQIKIKDTGCGIHTEDLYFIFKRFYRSKFTQDKQGVGLGLPLAKSIIELHNGTITVTSELEVGTVFTIRFFNPTKL